MSQEAVPPRCRTDIQRVGGVYLWKLVHSNYVKITNIKKTVILKNIFSGCKVKKNFMGCGFFLKNFCSCSHIIKSRLQIRYYYYYLFYLFFLLFAFNDHSWTHLQCVYNYVILIHIQQSINGEANQKMIKMRSVVWVLLVPLLVQVNMVIWLRRKRKLTWMWTDTVAGFQMWVVTVFCLVVDLLWSLRGLVITDKQEEHHHKCRDQTHTHTHTWL